MINLTRYQWTVLFAAWLGWGFDAFDGLLFNFVASNCIPTLLGLTIGSPEAKAPTLYWTGLLTSVLLLGWAVGGVLFGIVGDRIGRTKTLLLTILLYSLGTFACAFAPNIWVFTGCRIIASLGIGGEWAAGAAMVAEVVPERWRVEAGALLYTAAPIGLFLAAFANDQITRVILPGSPEVSWRYVFFTSLIPAAIAIGIRLLIKEPERWQRVEKQSTAHISELFTPQYRRTTLGGLAMAVVALLTWWNCNAFIPVIAAGLAQVAAKAQNIADGKATQLLIEQWKTATSYSFTAGGLIGTLLTVPVAKFLGRKWMFAIYFLLSAIAMLSTFGSKVPADMPLWSGLYFMIGLVVFGVLSSFTYYLPELFPTRLRATGAGFCYNIGRVITAIGPFLVGYIASQRANALQTTIELLFVIGFIPLVGVILSLTPWVTETREQILTD
ncbi:MFS transporter [uncultured Nostoc sp.]|uniref:MFS transporter n=1 Tax=uncultured Nostoc sp. TaxID=340711 RepID=UPI0035CB6816